MIKAPKNAESGEADWSKQNKIIIGKMKIEDFVYGVSYKGNEITGPIKIELGKNEIIFEGKESVKKFIDCLNILASRL